jgi:dynein heavy chain
MNMSDSVQRTESSSSNLSTEEENQALGDEDQSLWDSILQWFIAKIEGMLGSRMRSSVGELLTATDVRMIEEFVQDPTKRRLLVHFDNAEKIHIAFSLPLQSFQRKPIFFLKQRNFSIEPGGNVTGILVGDAHTDMLENLSIVSHEVLFPVLMAGKTKDPQVMTKDMQEVFHRFLSQIYLTVGQTQGKTLLPLPPRDPRWKDGQDFRQVRDKERVHVLESCVVTWTQQIKNVLRHEPPNYIHPGDISTGTIAEFSYWKNRAHDLKLIGEQLQDEKVLQVLKVLQASKSTYDKPFQKLVSEVCAISLQTWISSLSLSLCTCVRVCSYVNADAHSHAHKHTHTHTHI